MGLQFKSDSVAAPSDGLVLARLYNDPVIRPTTRYLFDAADPWSWPDQAAPAATDKWKDLTPNGADASFPATLPGFVNNGFAFSAAPGERIALPAAAAIGATSKGYAVALWIHVPADVAANKRVGGFHRNAQGPWFIYSAGARNYVIGVDGATQPIVLDAGLNQVVMSRCGDGNGGFLRRVHVNSQQRYGAPGDVAVSQPPADVTTASLGDDLDNSYLGEEWSGRIYRHWLMDVGAGGAITASDVDEVIALDWDGNKARW